MKERETVTLGPMNRTGTGVDREAGIKVLRAHALARVP